MNAFITGSHAYGTPREDSDIDLVVLVDQPTLDALGQIAEDAPEASRSGTGSASASIRSGKLNLIPHTEPAIFTAWLTATQELEARPYAVPRDEAVRLIKALMAVARQDAAV